MPTVRQLAEANKVAADEAVSAPARRRKTAMPFKLIKRGMSAIEYIVETARPGEVIHVTEADYYNPHLWRSYSDEKDPL